VVEWTGDEGSESPHSITYIVSEAANDQPVKQDAAQDKNTPSAPATTGTSSLPLTISILSAILSIISFVISTRKKVNENKSKSL
jgi:hypothetical protein